LRSNIMPAEVKNILPELHAIQTELSEAKNAVELLKQELASLDVLEKELTRPSATKQVVERPKLGNALFAQIAGSSKDKLHRTEKSTKKTDTESVKHELADRTLLRRMAKEYDSDPIFHNMVEKYLEEMHAQTNVPEAKKKKIMGQIKALYTQRQNQIEIEDRERIDLKNAEITRQATKLAQAEQKERIRILHDHGIDFANGSADVFVKEFATKVENAISAARRDMKKIPNIIDGLRAAISKKKDRIDQLRTNPDELHKHKALQHPKKLYLPSESTTAKPDRPTGLQPESSLKQPRMAAENSPVSNSPGSNSSVSEITKPVTKVSTATAGHRKSARVKTQTSKGNMLLYLFVIVGTAFAALAAQLGRKDLEMQVTKSLNETMPLVPDFDFKDQSPAVIDFAQDNLNPLIADAIVAHTAANITAPSHAEHAISEPLPTEQTPAQTNTQAQEIKPAVDEPDRPPPGISKASWKALNKRLR
ncbi:MAG TPA: hypothetical protein VLG38_02020, partial [Gammaproteobacteria bacterium]|nr:hypothetical protein [Gammaproteobacteria bacterium]